MIVTPLVGGDFYWTRTYAGTPFTLQVKVLNNGNVSLQIVANLTTPSGWDFDNTYSDCPTALAVGSYCTLSWVFTPQDTGYAYPRVYVRGFYTDSYGYSQRITQSPAYLVIVDP